MRSEVYAAIFYDNFAQGWRFHAWFSYFAIISSSSHVNSTPHEAITKLTECVGTVVLQPTHIHYVIYGNYADYEMDVYQQYLDTL